jgi:hypothetical protein
MSKVYRDYRGFRLPVEQGDSLLRTPRKRKLISTTWKCNSHPVAKPARQFGHAMQILNHYDY